MHVLLVLCLIVLPISAQHGFKPSITCYLKYDHEETKSQASNALLGYSYHQSEVTQYTTTENELCSKVGCACFSYRSVCSSALPGSNHYSTCTDNDRQDRAVKWHRGWASHDQCEQMRRNPQTYIDLTCCYTDLCNDQPGKITKVVDSQAPIQQQAYSYVHQGPQSSHDSFRPPQQYRSHGDDPYAPQSPQSSSDIYRPPQQYNNHGHDHYAHQTSLSPSSSYRPAQRYNSHGYYHSTTSRLPQTYKPSSADDKTLSGNNSLSLNSFSRWMIFFALVFCLFTIV